MNHDDAPLSERQQRMMAFVDDELGQAERLEFEREMAEDADLAAEVASHQALLHLTTSMSALEPADHEIRRFWSGFYNRTEWRLGWCLLLSGTVILVIWALVHLITAPGLSWIVKTAILSVCAGGGMLLWNTLRMKLHTSRFDRYKGVVR